MSNIPIQIKVSPVDKKQLRPLAKRMLDETWITAGRLLESEGEVILETNESEKFYTKFPQILVDEKIIVERSKKFPILDKLVIIPIVINITNNLKYILVKK